jgi:hypothetical protein
MRARLRGPEGTSTVNLADDATVGDLISQIIEKTSLSSFDIKYGYPPKPLLLKQSETSRPLKELDVKLDGEQLIISQREPPVVQQSSQSDTQMKTAHRTQIVDSSSSSNLPDSSNPEELERAAGPVSLQRKSMAGDVPELPLPERGATLGKFLKLVYRYSTDPPSPPRHAGRQQLSLPRSRHRRAPRRRPQHAGAALPRGKHHPSRTYRVHQSRSREEP